MLFLGASGKFAFNLAEALSSVDSAGRLGFWAFADSDIRVEDPTKHRAIRKTLDNLFEGLLILSNLRGVGEC